MKIKISPRARNSGDGVNLYQRVNDYLIDLDAVPQALDEGVVLTF